MWSNSTYIDSYLIHVYLNSNSIYIYIYICIIYIYNMAICDTQCLCLFYTCILPPPSHPIAKLRWGVLESPLSVCRSVCPCVHPAFSDSYMSLEPLKKLATTFGMLVCSHVTRPDKRGTRSLGRSRDNCREHYHLWGHFINFFIFDFFCHLVKRLFYHFLTAHS